MALSQGADNKLSLMSVNNDVFDQQNGVPDASVELMDKQDGTGQASPLALLLQCQPDLDISRAQEPFPAILVELDSLLRSHQRALKIARVFFELVSKK